MGEAPTGGNGGTLLRELLRLGMEGLGLLLASIRIRRLHRTRKAKKRRADERSEASRMDDAHSQANHSAIADRVQRQRGIRDVGSESASDSGKELP